MMANTEIEGWYGITTGVGAFSGKIQDMVKSLYGWPKKVDILMK